MLLGPRSAVRCWSITGAERNSRQQWVVRDSRVSEHAKTKSFTNSVSLSENAMLILEKWRPPGRFNSWRMAGWVVPSNTKSRVPVSLGGVKGAFHRSTPP